MHQALYRKWRPQTFDDVYGQEHITSILKYETDHGKFTAEAGCLYRDTPPRQRENHPFLFPIFLLEPYQGTVAF